jgi:hypothetical protein
LRIIKELNSNYKQKQIESNWLDPMRAQLIKDKMLQELKEPNVNEHETLIDILGYYKIKCDNRNKLRELLYKLDVKELDYLKSKGEKTNEKSSSKN